MKDFSLSSIHSLVKKEYPSVLNSANTLVNLVTIISKVYLPTDALGLLGKLLDAKGELSEIGEEIFKKIPSQKDENSLARLQRMETAYCLICYTAFFEAVQQTRPELMQEVDLKPKEKFNLSASAAQLFDSLKEAPLESYQVRLLDERLNLPHPVNGFDAQKEQLMPLYEALTKEFLSFLEYLAVWDVMDERQRGEIKKTTKVLPELSWKFFRAQYYTLAAKYEEFYVWASLQEHDATKSQLEQMSKYAQQQVALAKASQKAIDRGFNQLAETLQSLPVCIETRQANHTFKELANRYTSTIEAPIVRDVSMAKSPEPKLIYPKKSEIFIPQSFKVMRYTGREQLENETTWEDLNVRNDLGAFLLNYLSSPYSTAMPLIILGHPGSGKSLLTSMVASRLIPSLYTPIRVELRSVSADSDIVLQIEEYIHNTTSRDTSWAMLTDYLDEWPALVILDGYDELLQASGKVFADYLLKVQKFQENEQAMGRQPVRAIVTSRITLIDKAQIPTGAAILRLLEFDEEKRNQWTSVWNDTNQQFFSQTGVEPFKLPDGENIVNLAKQPLLLMMLALYDSDSNQLRQQTSIDQTALYDSLLRRFVERERKKEAEFRALEASNQRAEIESDMERLGVAALGMFNRRKLHIKARELNRDLGFFELERQVSASSGRNLSQADLLLGSFFFVYESRSATDSGDTPERNIDAAFEFLHNTFGEFLTAEFLVRSITTVVQRIHKLSRDKDFQTILDKTLTDPGKKWFAELMYTPLFSRPVVLNMMREWVEHSLDRGDIEVEDFLYALDMLIARQIEHILCKNVFLPGVMQERNLAFGELPIIGYAAIYSLNLILLRTVLSPQDYVFDESTIPPFEDGTRPWERLTSLWRSWFSLENLHGLTAILDAEREDAHKIRLSAKDTFSTSSSSNRLDLILNVSLALADDITTGLAGLLLYDPYRQNTIGLRDIEKRLNAEAIDLETMLMTKQLQEQSWAGYEQSYRIAKEAIRIAGRSHGRISNELVSLLTKSLRVARSYADDNILDEVYAISLELYSLEIWPVELATEVAQLARELGNDELLRDMYQYLYRNYSERMPVGLMVELLRLSREFYDRDLLRQIYVDGLQSRNPETWPVELVTEVAQWAYKLGDSEMLRDIYEHLHRSYSERTPVELLVELLRLSREFHDRDLLKRIYVDGLWRRGPNIMPVGLLVELIRLSREFQDRDLLGEVYMDRLQHQNPEKWPVELVTEVAQSARELGNSNILRDMYRHLLHMSNLEKISEGLLVELLRLSREFHDRDLLERVYRNRLQHRDPETWPVELVTEVAQLAQEIGNSEILRDIYKYLRRQDPKTWTVGVAGIVNQLAQEVGDYELEQELKRMLYMGLG